MAPGNQRDAIREDDQLRRIGAEAVNGNEDGVGQAGGYRRSEVSFIGFVEFLAKVIPSVERDDHLEIVQALLDLGAQAAHRLQALGILAANPRRRRPREQQQPESRRQARRSQAEIDAEEEHARAGHHEEAADELHQGLREELIQLVGVVVDPGDQVARLVLVEERERQLLQFREERIPQIEQQPLRHASHHAGLDVAREERDDIQGQEDAREQEDSRVTPVEKKVSME